MERIVAQFHAHAAVGVRAAHDPVEVLAARVVHGVDPGDLKRSEGGDRCHDFVGDPGGAELPAPVGRLAQLEALGRLTLHHARSRYRPVRVSTRIMSPWFTNSGTSTARPVSTTAGLNEALAVSPLNPGSLSVT